MAIDRHILESTAVSDEAVPNVTVPLGVTATAGAHSQLSALAIRRLILFVAGVSDQDQNTYSRDNPNDAAAPRILESEGQGMHRRWACSLNMPFTAS